MQGSGRSLPLGTTCVWTDDDGVFPSWDFLLDVGSEDGFREEIVDWDIEESLDLRSVQVESNDVVGSGDGEQVRDKSGCKLDATRSAC
jgi:hypothetical protein